MSFDLHILIKADVGEAALLHCFNTFFEGGVSTVDVENSDSVFFLHYFDYSEGFLCAAFLCWKGQADEFDELALARHIVSSFDTDVMFEPSNIKLSAPLEYVFVDRAGKAYAADYVDLEDGVDVLPESLILL